MNNCCIISNVYPFYFLLITAWYNLTYGERMLDSSRKCFFFSFTSFCPRLTFPLWLVRIDTWKKSLLTSRLAKLMLSFKPHSVMFYWTKLQKDKGREIEWQWHAGIYSLNLGHFIEHQYLLPETQLASCYHFFFQRLWGLLVHAMGHFYLVLLKYFLAQSSNTLLQQLQLYKDLTYQRLTVSVSCNWGISLSRLLQQMTTHWLA